MDCEGEIEEHHKKCDGLIMVFDPASSHGSVKPEFWEQKFGSLIEDTLDIGVRAMVAHACAPEDFLPEEKLNVWNEWCLERNLEFMEGDMETTIVRRGTRSLLDDTDEEQRGQGKERLYEALTSNMWPSMQKKEVPQLQDREKEVETGKKASDGEEDGDGDEDVTHLNYIDFDEYMKSVKGMEEEPAEDDLEKLMENDPFEVALNNARQMREHMLNLPDNERRELAAKFALQMFNMMGGLEEEEEEEEHQQQHEEEE